MRRTLKCICSLTVLSVAFIYQAIAQQPGDIYKKPLREVLENVEKTYHVKLRYDDRDVNDVNVSYATWRFTSDVKNTLDNILKPLNLAYQDKGKNVYEIGPYEYYRRSEAEGKKHLDELLRAYPNAEKFNKRKKELRDCILSALGITNFDNRTPLNTIYRSEVIMNGYSVQNVAFESVPGYYVTGTVYKPTNVKGPLAVIICPHGHFYNEQNPSSSVDSGRYRADMQFRCGGLAKMGAIVFNYDMYSWGESANQTGGYSFHETGFSEAIQTWNSIRALDFLLSLPGADKTRVGVTGASGGGTQTILVAAVDNRVTVTVPVVMVSSSFYGGCPCESGLPIHDECKGHKTNNAEIAALIAPKPMLVISDGSDWTTSVPGTDYPYLKKVYGFYGKAGNVSSVYLPNDKHDYGISKRTPMYHFFAKWFKMDLKAISGKDGKIDESSITIQPNMDLHVFSKDFPLPANALLSHAEIQKSFATVQQGKTSK
ncbi:MAG: alpha/beta hydrolase family protein [Chitinophagales bacterium]